MRAVRKVVLGNLHKVFHFIVGVQHKTQAAQVWRKNKYLAQVLSQLCLLHIVSFIASSGAPERCCSWSLVGAPGSIPRILKAFLGET